MFRVDPSGIEKTYIDYDFYYLEREKILIPLND